MAAWGVFTPTLKTWLGWLWCLFSRKPTLWGSFRRRMMGWSWSIWPLQWLFRGRHEGDGSRNGYMLEAFLTYLLSLYVLSSGPEGGLNPYVFLLAILIAKRSNTPWPGSPWVVVHTAIRMCGECGPVCEEVRCCHSHRLVLPLDDYMEVVFALARKLMEYQGGGDYARRLEDDETT